ncbi:MAG: HAMP domain-containing protein, partial [Desulfobacterota bacterium]|nr:HAMP domain-containing protein [Thermodesulfobacteriota bacterium]
MNYKAKIKSFFELILFLKSQTNLDPEEKRRRLRERYIIIITAFLIIGLTFLESYISRTRGKLPISSNILVHFILNLNIILLVLLIFLVIRNIVKLFFERRRGILGTRLRTKLVISFVALTIIPTILLFGVSANLITSTIDNLFSFQIERSLKESLEIAKAYYQNLKDNSIFFARNISKAIEKKNLLHPDNAEQLQKLIEHRLKEYNLGAIEILSYRSSEPKSLAIAFNKVLEEKIINKINFKIVLESSEIKNELVKIQSLREGGELIRGIVPIFSTSGQIKGLVVVSYYLPKKLVRKMQGISNRFAEYQQLNLSQPPIKPTYILLLANITLLLFFSAIMFGFHLAKNLTGPIKELAEGTLKVAKGDLEVQIELRKADDEIGFLVDSFNRMIQDLKNGRAQLEQINKDLQDINLELDKRRTYMEIVLKNVAAGVISIDQKGEITTINNSVGKILGLDKVDNFINKNYKEILPPKYLAQVEALLDEVDLSSNITFEKEIKLTLPKKTLDLSISITPLKDEKGDYLGLVIVVEDVTELQKGQRIAAWREVARRIAHEIKNPLTPI